MKKTLSLILALCALLLSGCAKQPSAPERVQAPEESQAPAVTAPAETVPETAQPAETVPETAHFEGNTETVCGELVLQIPCEYAELLITDIMPEAWDEHWTPLFSLSELDSLTAFERDHPDGEWGTGWLCTVSRLDRIGFEEYVCEDNTGSALFARDGDDRYYIISRPTGVRLYRSGDVPDEASQEQWQKLSEWAETLTDSLIERNSLTPYDASELFRYDYTYAGKHVELACRFPDEPMDLAVLSLSQPERQGEGGIWCVERVLYVYSEFGLTVTQLVFPAALGFDETAAEHYARLQRECDAGEHSELLTPEGAAVHYARLVSWQFGEDISETDFKPIVTLG